MKLKSFVVCGRKFNVEYISHPPGGDAEGVCNATSNQIFVWEREAEDKTCEEDTVFHEVLEAMNAVMGIGLKHNQIIALAAAFQQFNHTGKWEK